MPPCKHHLMETRWVTQHRQAGRHLCQQCTLSCGVRGAEVAAPHVGRYEVWTPPNLSLSVVAQAFAVVGTLSFSLVAYLAGNRQCETDQFGMGCGRIRWAAVQIKRKGIAMCAHPALEP